MDKATVQSKDAEIARLEQALRSFAGRVAKSSDPTTQDAARRLQAELKRIGK